MIYNLGLFSRFTCNKFPGIKIGGGSKVCKHSAPLIYVEEMFFLLSKSFSHETLLFRSGH